MSAKYYPPLKQQWSSIAALIAGGGIPDKCDIASALRNATSEIDDIIRLLHSPEVAAFLQMHQGGLDPVVEQFIDALNALLFRCLPIIPAEVQYHIADLIDPPKRPAYRPKQKLTDMARVQRDHQKLDQARQDLAEMDALLVRHHGDEAAAFTEFAKTKGKGKAKRQRGITVPAAKRRYRQAAKVVEADRSFWEKELEQLAQRFPQFAGFADETRRALAPAK